MKKCLKRLVSIVLVFCLSFLTTFPAFATNPSTYIPPTITILKDDNLVRMVKEINADGITIATNDKVTHLLTIEKYDYTGKNLISSQVLNLEKITSEASKSPNDVSLNRAAELVDSENTFTNYEYAVWEYVGAPNEWRCRVPDETIWVDETSSSLTSYLERFRDNVQNINSAEADVIISVGTTVAVAAFAAFVSGGLAAAVAAIPTGSSAVKAFIALDGYSQDAEYNFSKIKKLA